MSAAHTWKVKAPGWNRGQVQYQGSSEVPTVPNDTPSAKRRGRPAAIRTADQFWSMVQRGAPQECWPWLGRVDSKGYGRTGSGHLAEDLTHRTAWILSNGPIPDGLWVLHRCDHRPCCNPSHLYLGTHQQNMKDMAERGRRVVGERVGTARLTEVEVQGIKEMRASGATYDAISKRFGTARSNACGIVKGYRWKHTAALGQPPTPEDDHAPT